MLNISLTQDANGIGFRAGKATRYVPNSLIGTAVETRALRELVIGSRKPVAVATSNLRAPGDWPSAMRANDRATLAASFECEHCGTCFGPRHTHTHCCGVPVRATF